MESKGTVMLEKPIGLILVGHPSALLLEKYGDYDVWFRNALGFNDDSALLKVYNVFDGEVMPTPEELEMDCSGVIITGSPAYVTDKHPWSVATGRVLAELSKRAKIPILGVCYGHQLLCDGMGGKVGFNPNGRSQGSKTIELNREACANDPLFGIFANQVSIIGHVCHMQVALELPEGAVVLGRNPVDPNHVVRFGPKCWGTQFHPEFDEAMCDAHITLRMAFLKQEGTQKVEEWIKSIRPSDAGPRLFKRFLDLCADPQTSTEYR